MLLNKSIGTSFTILGLLLCLYYFGLNITGIDLSYFPGDNGDARFNNYILEHAYIYCFRGGEHFWNAPFMFPEKNVITYSDNLLGIAPFYIAFRVLCFDREMSFQLLFLFLICLNYLSSFLLLNYVFKKFLPAILGAIVYSTSIALQSQIGHLQTMPRFALPIVILMAMKFVQEPYKIKYFFMLALAFVYQIYCGIYLGLLSLMPIFLFVLFSVLYFNKNFIIVIKTKLWWLKILVSVTVNIIFLLIIMIPYRDRADALGLNKYEDVVSTIPTILSHFFASKGSLLWVKLENVADDYTYYWDFKIFAGGVATFSLIAFIVIIIYKLIFKQKIEKNYLIFFYVIIFLFLFFLRFEKLSAYKILYYLPGFGSMRALQRIINIELLFFAFTTAFLFYFLSEKISEAKKIIFFLLLMFVLFIDNTIDVKHTLRVPKKNSQIKIQQIVERLKHCKKDVIVSYEPDTLIYPSHEYQIDAMLACQTLGLKCINAYTGYSPFGFDSYWREPNEITRTYWLRINKMEFTKCYVLH